MKKVQVAPSILSADFRTLQRDVEAVVEAGSDMIHCDVMDGTFVPNISFGPMIISAVKKCVSVSLDVHLMIVNPENYITQFVDAGADIITVHAEACKDLPMVLEKIRASGAKVGVTVNPDKPIDLFMDYLDIIDMVLIMSVYAGFGGQSFITDTMDKVKTVYDTATKENLTLDIEVDGGVNGETAKICGSHGANILVAGSYVFNGDYRKRIDSVRTECEFGLAQLN